MKWIARIIVSFGANILALSIANSAIKEFSITADLQGLLLLAGILTLLNITIRPILKLFLSPFIILTAGLFIIVINAGILFALDILSESITIDGISALFYATILISIVHVLVYISYRILSFIF